MCALTCQHKGFSFDSLSGAGKSPKVLFSAPLNYLEILRGFTLQATAHAEGCTLVCMSTFIFLARLTETNLIKNTLQETKVFIKI